MTAISPRNRVMLQIRESAELVRQGSYFVKRGVIKWAGFDFGAHPRAIALHIDEMTIGRVPMDKARLAFEIASSMPEENQKPEIDDGLLDELMEDAEFILDELVAARDADDPSFPTVFKLIKNATTVVEFHDTERRIQGIVVSVEINY